MSAERKEMAGLTPEERFLFSIMRGDVIECSAPAAVPIDYKLLLKAASVNLVSTRLYRNIGQLRDLPDDFVAALRTAYYSTLNNNILHLKETMRLVKCLADAGIGAIPVKGSVASEFLFDDIGLYPTYDIDLLVRPEHIPKAEEELRKAGYDAGRGISRKDLLSSHYHLIFQNGRYVVELHWNLVKRYFKIPPEFWWEKTLLAECEGTRLLQLSAERYLLYSVFHLFSHGFRPLKFLVLVSGIIERYRGGIDWAELIGFSRQYKMERLTIFTLKLVHELLGTEVPKFILRQNVVGHNFLKGSVMSGFFTEDRSVHRRMLNYIMLMQGPIEIAKTVLGRIFPRPGELRLRFGLSEKSRSVYLFYFLNPFLMLLKRK